MRQTSNGPLPDESERAQLLTGIPPLRLLTFGIAIAARSVGVAPDSVPVLIHSESEERPGSSGLHAGHRCYPSRVSPLRLVWGVAAVTQA